MFLIVFTLHYHCHHPHYSSSSCSLSIPLSFILSLFSISLSPRHNTNPSVLHPPILWSQEEDRRIPKPQKDRDSNPTKINQQEYSILITIIIIITIVVILYCRHKCCPYRYCHYHHIHLYSYYFSLPCSLSILLPFFLSPSPFLLLLVITPSFTHQDDGPQKKTTETAERIP